MREVRSGLSTIVEQAKLSEQETAASVDDVRMTLRGPKYASHMG